MKLALRIINKNILDIFLHNDTYTYTYLLIFSNNLHTFIWWSRFIDNALPSLTIFFQEIKQLKQGTIVDYYKTYLHKFILK